MNQQDAITRLGELARRPHDTCEDSFYSCPKSPDGCANDAAGKECNCGADEHNAEVDRVLVACGHGKDSEGWVRNTGTMPECGITRLKLRDGTVVHTMLKERRDWTLGIDPSDITHYKTL